MATVQFDLYFYHPDHLSSASWITDIAGTAIQHLQYLPFGETRVDQRTTIWNSRYSFSAKEKDEESGYGYFGARYYDSDLSIWLSVDPMSDKYPGLSPYNYCANNPVKLVDPNGMEIVGTDGQAVTYSYDKKGQVVWSKNTSKDVERIGNAMLGTETGKKQFDKMSNSETKISMEISAEKKGKDGSTMGEMKYDDTKVKVDRNGDAHIPSAKITIFEGSIKSYLNNENERNNVWSDHTSMGTASYGASIDEYIGAVAGHEAEHITSQANINLHYNHHDAEIMPNRVKTNILWEAKFNKILRP